MEFLSCLPEMAEQTMTKKNLQVPFVKAGMTDKETECFPVYDRLLGTCKRYVSMATDVGLPKSVKLHVCQYVLYSTYDIYYVILCIQFM